MASEFTFAQYLEEIGLRRLDGQAGQDAREALERFRQEADSDHRASTDRLRCEYQTPLAWSVFGQADQFDDLVIVGEMLGSIDAPRGSRVLDLGGGPGIFAGWMARCWQDSRIVVVDPAVPDDLPWRIELEGVMFVREAWPTQAALEIVARIHPEGYSCATMLRLGRSACLHNGIDPGQAVQHFGTMAAALPSVLEADASILIADYPDYLPMLIETFSEAGFRVQHEGDGCVVFLPPAEG